ncbi:hypothetical protein EYC80_007729 [Monilinia laxa]|uniref:Uncharacterized protein n=1 Tax=Monilinia laxa TaxID=61186 RepID=A0A5N6JWU1_MONLA|nr:hypothetical protein EYC80_007729 [Monilinia laxa]
MSSQDKNRGYRSSNLQTTLEYRRRLSIWSTCASHHTGFLLSFQYAEEILSRISFCVAAPPTSNIRHSIRRAQRKPTPRSTMARTHLRMRGPHALPNLQSAKGLPVLQTPLLRIGQAVPPG